MMLLMMLRKLLEMVDRSRASSAKHQRGQVEEDGLVIVDVGDVKSAGH
jgi:hypothetical protein